MTGWMLLASLALAETTVSVDNLSVDGLQVSALRCTLDRGGLLASAMVVGALAAQKETLDRCAPPGTPVTIRWTWADDTTVTHIDDQEVTTEHCVYKALRPISPPSRGSCTATVLLGEAPKPSAEP